MSTIRKLMVPFIVAGMAAGIAGCIRPGTKSIRPADYSVPYPVKGPAVKETVRGVPVVEAPDTTLTAEKAIYPGKGWRSINTGTLQLLHDRLPYLDTPHQEWAKPYRGGKLKVLYINGTSEIGEAAMLEQRGDLECTIYCKPQMLDWYGEGWETNAVFVGFLERRMKELLALDPDVIVVNYVMGDLGKPSEGGASLPISIHQMVLNKVKDGAGLVIIPDGEITPKATNGWDCISQTSPLHYKKWGNAGTVYSGTHPITDGIPLELFGLTYLIQSEPAADAKVPILLGKTPFLALSEYGKGRVVAFAYSGRKSIPDHAGDGDAGLSAWNATAQCLQDEAWHWYEYGYSMLIKAIVWAGKKEPRINVTTQKIGIITQGESIQAILTISNTAPEELALTLKTTVRNSDYETAKELTTEVTLPSGGSKPMALDVGNDFRKGFHLIDVIIRNKSGQVENWASMTFTVTNSMLLTVKPDKEFYQAGDTVRLSTMVNTAGQTNLTLQTELWDTFGRLMAVKDRSILSGESAFTDSVEFSLGNAVGYVFDVKTSVMRGGQCLEKRSDEISIPRYEWGDDWRNKMWNISYSQRDIAYKAIGIDDMTSAGWAHRIGGIRRNARGNFGTHAWSCDPHPSSTYPKGPDDDQRHPLVLDPERIKKEDKNIQDAAGIIRKYGVIGFSLSGEFVCEYDSSYDSFTLKAFNEYLKQKHTTLDALNSQWGTQYRNWDEVGPIKTADWKKKQTANFSQWMEFRRFMDSTLTDAHVHAAELWRKELHAPVHVGHEQTFGLWQATIPYGAFDYYGMLSQGLNCWISYNGSDSGVFTMPPYVYASDFEWFLLTSWCKGPIRGIAGWPSGGMEGWMMYDGKCWSALFNGGAGMDWYEPSMFNAGYTALLPMGAAIYRATHEIKSGIGKALLTAERRRDPVAIWQDMANEYAQWLQGNTVAFTRWHVVKMFYSHAIKPVAVSSDQVEAGYLLEKGIKLLYMPNILCVSKKAGEQVKQFVEKGGTVIADYGAGAFDELGKPLSPGHLDDVFGITRTELNKKAGDSVPVFSGDAPEFPLPIGEYPASSQNNFWESGLAPTTGKTLGTISKKTPAPAFILNSLGKGHALLLNFCPENYARPVASGGSANKDLFYNLAGAMLALAGITPEIRVVGADKSPMANKPLKYFDLNRFKRGSAWYIGALRYPDMVPKDSPESKEEYALMGPVRYPDITDEPDEVTIEFPEKGHIYELRSHRYTGYGDKVNDVFKAGDFSQAAKIYAVVPYEIKAVKLDMPRTAKCGEVFKYTVSVAGADGTVDHVLRIEVINPEGRVPECYQQKALALKGRYAGQLPFALNDMHGAWQIRAIDVISGKEAARAVVVK